MSDNPILVNEDGDVVFEPDYWTGNYYWTELRDREYVDLKPSTPDELRELYGMPLFELEGANLALYRMIRRHKNDTMDAVDSVRERLSSGEW